MKFQLRYPTKFQKFSAVIKSLCFALMCIIYINFIIFVAFLILTVSFELELSRKNIYIIRYIFIITGSIITGISLLGNNKYVRINSKGILIHNCNTVHFGLGQHYRFNVLVPFNRIVNCKIDIPIDCPKNYKYKFYKKYSSNDSYYDYRKKVGVMKTKEPAIADGRFNEECILLELDNKRIIVIPIDECSEFLEVFNKYFSIYKESIK